MVLCGMSSGRVNYVTIKILSFFYNSSKKIVHLLFNFKVNLLNSLLFMYFLFSLLFFNF